MKSMQKLVCEICGGTIEIQPGGEMGMCSYCGTGYTIDRIKEIYSGMKVSITGSIEDIEQWKKALKVYLEHYDFDAASTTARKILDALPTDTETLDIFAKIQDWKWYEIKNNTLVMYHGAAEYTEIPYGISKIGKYAFALSRPNNGGKREASVKRVIIPDTVKIIDEGAFKENHLLESIEFPKNLYEIGEYAFEQCSSLTKIKLPKNLKTIESYSFRACNNLEEIIIPQGVAEIKQGAFQGCESLTTIIIPGSVKSIFHHAFGNCNSLTSLTILNRNLYLHEYEGLFTYYVFDECYSLSTVEPYDFFLSHIEHFKNTKIYRELLEQRRNKNKCQYCGGEFKGIITKKCSVCGKIKNY